MVNSFPLRARALSGLALLSLTFSACNQAVESPDPEKSAVPAVQESQTPGEPVRLDIGEGQPLQGKQLEEFLGKLPAEVKDRAAAGAAQGAPGALAKTAWNACTINFNSSTGLRNMADKAYTSYAVAPWYYQYCAPSNFFVVPTNYNNYYLIPEAANTCIGSYGKIGYGSITNCQNQKSADLFPRYAGISTSTDGAVGIRVHRDQYQHFKLNSYIGKGGSIKVYAYRIGIGWWYWGPLPGNNTYWTFSNATQVSEVVFHSANMYDPFYFDDVNVTPL